MSKHSKWAKVKNQKAATDQKKAAVFTKHVRAISVAARQGSDAATNFKLRMAIESAKAAGVLKDTIERAVKKGAGESEKTAMEELLYEGFAPGGVSLLIEVLTDNKNRTASDLRHLLEQKGGSLANSGSVAWQFERRGVARLNIVKNEDLELRLIDLGAEDIKEEEGALTIYVKPENLQKFLDGLASLKLAPEYSGLEWATKEARTITDPAVRARLDELYELLDGRDDVQNYFTNEE